MILMFFVIMFLAIIFAILQVAFRWIMLGIIIACAFCMMVEFVIYNVFKKNDVFNEQYLEQVEKSKFGKYKKIFILLFEKGLKISMLFTIIVIIACSIAFYINPFENKDHIDDRTNTTIERRK